MEPLGGVKIPHAWSSRSLVESIPEILIEGERLSSPHDNGKDGSTETRTIRPKGISSLRHLPFCGKSTRNTPKSIPDTIVNGHIFCNHNFKKATFCDVCHRLLVDATTKEFTTGPLGFQRQGLRCKICKANLHATCTDQVEECQGSPLGSFSFSRQLSPSGSTPENGCLSPGNGKRRSPKAKIDSVYQVLKEGLVLRASTTGPGSSLSRNQSIESNSSQAGSDCGKQSISNSPTVAAKFKKTTTTSDNTAAQVSEEKALSNCSSDGFTPISDERPDNRKQNDRNDGGDYTMVALHKFEGQQRDDLLLRPGDIISVTDDRDEAWWIGTREGKSGFFPSNFAMKLNSGEVVYSCLRVAHLMDINNKEVPLKKNQIVVVKPEVKVQDNNYVYSRIPNVEGYVKREDLKPV
uniref:SH3 and cysteine-rich domain-containing protein n=1 Tax=Ciona savignyi TaxID=51511 RepID=H2YDA6_CIOSA